MIDKSFAWAAARGKTRRNSVHGEEEAKLVLEDWFDSKDQHGQRTAATGRAEVEDMWSCVCEFFTTSYAYLLGLGLSFRMLTVVCSLMGNQSHPRRSHKRQLRKQQKLRLPKRLLVVPSQGYMSDLIFDNVPYV